MTVAEARRLHGRDFEAAANLLTTSVASASPSISSAIMTSGFPDCTVASRIGNIACNDDSFFVDEDVGLLELTTIFSALVMKNGQR